ncbi:MAG: hypothetical protein WD035_09150 [Balneolaceae bacterium]
MGKKPVKILFGTLLVYALLVATHLGEFWPLSIYPMFSQAGNPWSRAIVYEADPADTEIQWATIHEEELPDRVFPLDNIGLNTNDLANLLSKNTDWSRRRIQSIRRYFGDYLQGQSLVIYRVRGKYEDEGGENVVIEFTPYFYLMPDTTYVNPQLTEE